MCFHKNISLISPQYYTSKRIQQHCQQQTLLGVQRTGKCKPVPRERALTEIQILTSSFKCEQAWKESSLMTKLGRDVCAAAPKRVNEPGQGRRGNREKRREGTRRERAVGPRVLWMEKSILPCDSRSALTARSTACPVPLRLQISAAMLCWH